MKAIGSVLSALVLLTAPAFASVSVSSPANGSTVASPAVFAATATSTCAKGVAAVGVYVNNQLAYKQNGSTLNTSLPLSPGSYQTVVQEWDQCGGASSTPVNIVVAGSGGTSTGVTVTAPVNNTTVPSPTVFTATAASATCSKGIASMGIYVGGKLQYVGNGASLNTSIAFPMGPVTAVVQAWDNCGGATTKSVGFTVGSSTATTVSLTATPASVVAGGTATLAAVATNATGVVIAGSDGTSYTLGATGGSQNVAPAKTTTYTATATGTTGTSTAATTVTVTAPVAATATLSANPSSIAAGGTATLSWTTTGATQVSIAGSDGSSYTALAASGSQVVTPAAKTSYTLTAAGPVSTATASASVLVTTSAVPTAVNHVVFMLQENHSFDNYFGMLNPYRVANNMSKGEDGNTYMVDGIDDKLGKISNANDEGSSFGLFKFKSTCVDDMTSAWLESYGDVSRYNFTPNRPIQNNGFVHTAENYAKACIADKGQSCSGAMTDMAGQRAMGYYDQGFLNYYYYMASQFAVSDRWFSPIASKSIPNRIATFSGGTTQGLVLDPGNDDHLPQLQVNSIFEELDQYKVPWKVYYTVTAGSCLEPDDCPGAAAAQYPGTDFEYISYSFLYLYENPSKAACRGTTKPSSVVGDKSNSFCIDPTRFAPLSQYYTDVANGTLPAFAFIEAGYGNNDEHPGSGQSVLQGQAEVAKVVGSLMNSPSWKDTVFFLSYDEGGGPYDHVPPVPGHSNDFTSAFVGGVAKANIPDIKSISVNADNYKACVPPTGTPTMHCDLGSSMPGAQPGDAPSLQGMAAQLGFRVPNIVISPFTRQHYVSHIPMDHTAILKFVENRFIGPSAHITSRDAAQPNLMDFFDFAGAPWATPPTPPTPQSPAALGFDPCTAATFHP